MERLSIGFNPEAQKSSYKTHKLDPISMHWNDASQDDPATNSRWPDRAIQHLLVLESRIDTVLNVSINSDPGDPKSTKAAMKDAEWPKWREDMLKNMTTSCKGRHGRLCKDQQTER